MKSGNSYSYSQRKGVLSLDWNNVHELVNGIGLNLKEKPDIILGISRGGLYPATLLSHLLQVELLPIKLSRRINDIIVYQTPKWIVKPAKEYIHGKKVLIVDEICDSGVTIGMVKEFVRSLKPESVQVAVLYSHTKASHIPDYIGVITDELILNPWDRVVLKDGKFVPNSEYIRAFELQDLNPQEFSYSTESIKPEKS